MVAEEILDWGGMDPLSAEMTEELHHSLLALDQGGEELLRIHSSRIASISKVYEMWSPHQWVIFDSYCARGLQWMIAAFCGEMEDNLSDLVKLPCPPGRVCLPYEGFPVLGTENQARLGFIYCSWLARAIADSSNNNGYFHGCSASHIEMVAFSIGHRI